MKFRAILLLVIGMFLMGCSEIDGSFKEAVSSSRDGVAALMKSEKNDISSAEKEDLLGTGKKNLAHASELYQALIESDPENGVYYNNYGWVLMRSGDLSGARAAYEKATKYKDSISPQSSLDKNIAELSSLEEK